MRIESRDANLRSEETRFGAATPAGALRPQSYGKHSRNRALDICVPINKTNPRTNPIDGWRQPSRSKRLTKIHPYLGSSPSDPRRWRRRCQRFADIVLHRNHRQLREHPDGRRGTGNRRSFFAAARHRYVCPGSTRPIGPPRRSAACFSASSKVGVFFSSSLFAQE